MNAEFHIQGKVIQTERLILRAFRETDVDDFFAYASVEGVGEMAGWPHHKSKEESHSFLKKFVEEDKTFAICFKENGRVIGSLGVEKYHLEDVLSEFFDYKGREIGYVLSKEYWGKGLMPEALRAVIDHLFLAENLDFLLCGYYDFNTRSRRVQEKCGFRPYRKLVMDTRLGAKEPGVLNLLLNPDKRINLQFSHPETLIYKKNTDTGAVLID